MVCEYLANAYFISEEKVLVRCEMEKRKRNLIAELKVLGGFLLSYILNCICMVMYPIVTVLSRALQIREDAEGFLTHMGYPSSPDSSERGYANEGKRPPPATSCLIPPLLAGCPCQKIDAAPVRKHTAADHNNSCAKYQLHSEKFHKYLTVKKRL